MKTSYYIFLIVSALISGTEGCNREIDDPIFDYNLKSAKVINTNNEFGIGLLKEVIGDEEASNVMISPASVSIALGMAYNGAETTTRDAFEEVFNYEGLTRDEVNQITKELINVLITNAKGNLLEIANSIWYDDGFPVEQNFIDLNSNYFDAEVREVNFRSGGALQLINDWVSRKTHGKIDKIIDSIEPEMMMILINAIYFNCLWEVEFDPKETRDAPFYDEKGQVYDQVAMMQLEHRLDVSFTDDYKAVELPYRNGKFSMYLFLPEGSISVDELIARLNGETWTNWVGSFAEQGDFKVYLPKFKFEYKRSLSDDLKSLGLEVAFTDEADFSGISPVDLLISNVIHKTYIDVNEEGTEAAAVTGVVLGVTSAGPPSFIRLDRPFMFAITENTSNSILFIGKVSEPAYD